MMDSTKIAAEDRQLTVSLPDERVNVCIGSGTYSIVIKGADTAERFAMIDMWIPPGGGPMPHSHLCEETFYVMEGEVAVFCGETRTLAPTGSAMNIPSWAPHVFHNLSDKPARLMCTVSPAGLDRQFLEIGVRVATRTSPPPSVSAEQRAELMKKIPAIVEKYDGKVLPPDAFDHLMTPEEIQFLKDAEGA
ncbi:quercetin dioxygenase-like cupin family protein [Granulicella aggregans]|uniref:Quercetin dioxygenase-like cupin family protein n=1 Tax=Granulicella aggregans TaxID=474949 RepID=A0A7W7Z9M6_9BACT|nr:cupin domain-containing protein [Granulicella aggregans]MBB5055840.1 quercetin dioxygenase-like cupin family protein [Granulicella aggregans]